MGQQKTKYVAFLRGINVGGKNPVRMEPLRGIFEDLGFAGVRTILASGNVVFEAERGEREVVARRVEDRLRETFGKRISVVVRSNEDMQALVDGEPFKGIEATKAKLYVTFFPESRGNEAELPGAFSKGVGRIVYATAREICTCIDPESGLKTPDLMAQLDREFGRDITTRSWSTILKVMEAFGR